jgi:hypothetical protein
MLITAFVCRAKELVHRVHFKAENEERQALAHNNDGHLTKDPRTLRCGKGFQKHHQLPPTERKTEPGNESQ